MYLINDPLPAISVDYYTVDLDGQTYRADAEPSQDQTQKRLHWEIPTLPDGEHTVRVQAVNGWGTGEWSDPFVFMSAMPPKVSGLALSST